MAKANHQYEAMFLFGQSAAQDLEGAQNQVRQIVERHGGQVMVLKRWDERKLAYEIGKQKRGTYIICYYTGPGSSVSAMERDVNLSDNVLRVLVTSADHLNQQEMEAVEPQPIIREERPSWERPQEDRGRREDRPDRGPREERAPRAPRREEPAPAEAGAAKE
ncbi:MAG TPA: 30S ribosomal protein S6 [Tepidisphaeraceae bacterium]|nr:30S ribosomal protein S6 [Tepidisphaeraceae bacterium]